MKISLRLVDSAKDDQGYLDYHECVAWNQLFKMNLQCKYDDDKDAVGGQKNS